MDVTLSIVNDGDVKIRLENNSGSAVEDQLVRLFNFGTEIATQTTDGDGWVTFYDVLEGTYFIQSEDIEISNLEYTVGQSIQVLTDKTREYTLDVTDYAGSVEVTVYEQEWDDLVYEAYEEPAANVVVRVFDFNDIDLSMDVEDVTAITLKHATTNANGVVKIVDLPFGRYGILLHNSDWSEYAIQYDAFYIDQQGEELELEYVINFI